MAPGILAAFASVLIVSGGSRGDGLLVGGGFLPWRGVPYASPVAVGDPVPPPVGAHPLGLWPSGNARGSIPLRPASLAEVWNAYPQELAGIEGRLVRRVQLSTDDVEAFFLLSVTYGRMYAAGEGEAMLSSAARLATHLLELAPGDPRGMMAIAEVLIRTGNDAAARDFLAEWARRHGDDSWFYALETALLDLRETGDVSAFLGRGDEIAALPGADRAVIAGSAASVVGAGCEAASPETRAGWAEQVSGSWLLHRDVHYLVADGYIKYTLGRYADAARVYREALRVDPGNKQAMFLNAIIVGHELGNPRSGLRAIERVKAKYWEGLDRYQRATLLAYGASYLARLGKVDEAVREFSDALGTLPDVEFEVEALLVLKEALVAKSKSPKIFVEIVGGVSDRVGASAARLVMMAKVIHNHLKDPLRAAAVLNDAILIGAAGGGDVDSIRKLRSQILGEEALEAP